MKFVMNEFAKKTIHGKQLKLFSERGSGSRGEVQTPAHFYFISGMFCQAESLQVTGSRSGFRISSQSLLTSAPTRSVGGNVDFKLHWQFPIGRLPYGHAFHRQHH